MANEDGFRFGSWKVLVFEIFLKSGEGGRVFRSKQLEVGFVMPGQTVNGVILRGFGLGLWRFPPVECCALRRLASIRAWEVVLAVSSADSVAEVGVSGSWEIINLHPFLSVCERR